MGRKRKGKREWKGKKRKGGVEEDSRKGKEKKEGEEFRPLRKLRSTTATGS